MSQCQPLRDRTASARVGESATGRHYEDCVLLLCSKGLNGELYLVPFIDRGQ